MLCLCELGANVSTMPKYYYDMLDYIQQGISPGDKK
jgi:hypothetical protein